MNKMKNCILLAAAGCLLISCTPQTPSGESQAESSAAESSVQDNSSAEQKETDEKRQPTTMPVISIQTVNQDPDVLDFVNVPVAQHVAEDIASWTPGYKIPPAPYYETCKVSLRSPDGGIQLEEAEAEVKVRGNWTTTYDKKPLRMKFTEKQKLMNAEGGAEAKNWLLLACYKDASMLRDKTALQIAREILEPDGFYASDAELVEVEINGAYWGVYLLTDMQQVHPDRVDINDPEKDYQGTDIGYFLEFDGYYYHEDPLHQFYVDYMDNAPLKPYDGNDGSGRTITCLPEDKDDMRTETGITIKSDIYSQEQHDFIASYVNNVYDIMYHAAYDNKAYSFTQDYTKIEENADLTPQEAVEAVVNIDSLADMYIISELTCDADIYWSSFFMDVDFSTDGDKKLTFEAPWDFDSGLGNKKRCADGTGFYAANIVPDVNGEDEYCNPWLTVLMYQEWYQDVIRHKWSAAYDAGVFDRAIQQITADKNQYADAFKENDKKWGMCMTNPSIANELSAKAKKCVSEKLAADYLTDWLTARVAFMNEQWHI